MSVRICLGVIEKEIWSIRLQEHYKFCHRISEGYHYPKAVNLSDQGKTFEVIFHYVCDSSG